MSGYDYRWMSYPHSSVSVVRPHDDTLLAIRGHDVASTLIRAYWSPLATTSGRYVYSGSACGGVFVFDAVTGHIAHELMEHTDTVRDCSWHPSESRLVSVSWDGRVCEWRSRNRSEPFAVRGTCL